MLQEIAPHLGPAPGRQRVDLHQAVREKLRVGLEGRQLRPGGWILVVALAGDPCVDGRELAAQGLHLALLAAFMMAIAVKGGQTLLVHHGLEETIVRKQHLDGDTKVLAHLIDEAIGLREKPPCIQGKDTKRLACGLRHVDQHHILGPAEGDGSPGETPQGQLHDDLRFQCCAAGVEFLDICSVHSRTP